MRTRTTAACLLAAALALTACSSADGRQADAKPKSSSTKPKPGPTPAGPLTFGRATTWRSEKAGKYSTGSTTALSYRQPIRGVTPPGEGLGADTPKEEWGALEAKVCVDKSSTGNVSVSQFPWSLAFADWARVSVTGSSGGDFPRPEFPMDAIVKPGDCVRGLMMFPVPVGKRPERIMYAPEGMDPTEWAVPAK